MYYNIFEFTIFLFCERQFFSSNFFGWKYFYNSFEKFLTNNEYFYLLFHPADFTSSQDISKKYKNYLQRFNISVEEKIKILENIFLAISKSKRKCITMEELANYYINKN